MKTTVVVAGIVILIVGLGILAYGFSYTTNQTTTTQAVPKSQRSIDGNGLWAFGVNLKSGEKLNGTAQIASYNSSAGPIFVYIQNESTYIYWGGCAPCGLPSGGYSGFENYTLPASGVESFTWTAPYTGSFYVVFDNEYYGQGANASLAATGSTVTTSTGNSTLVFAGLGVAVVGIIIAIAGATMGGTPKPPKPLTTATSKTTASPATTTSP